MQPYFMPYIGYFQLMTAVDKFVFYDDAGFIKQGWINRNNILLNGQRHLFTIPVRHISSNARIKETLVATTPPNWERALLRTFEQAYRKTLYFDAVFPFIADILRGSAGRSVADVAVESIEKTALYLGIEPTTGRSFGTYDNLHLTSTARVIDICRQEGATTYINAIGGQSLYDKGDFEKHNRNLLIFRNEAHIRDFKL